MIFLQGSAPSGFGARLINWDYKAFSLINQRWHNGTMDTLAPFFREANTWIPFYFFILLFVVFNFGVFFRELEMRANATKLLINRVDDVKVYSGYLQRKIEENNIINYSQTFLLV